MYDVIVLGSATIDCFVDTGTDLFQCPEKHDGEYLVHVPFGTKIIAKQLLFMTGGGGTNTSVAFSRLGLKVAYVGKIGGDRSKIILKELKKEKVDTSLVVKGDETGYSVIIDAKGRDRTIITHKGSNDLLTYNEIKKSKLKTKWFYLCSMTGKSYNALLKMVDYAKKNSIKIAFNPSSYVTKHGYKKLKKVLEATNVLIFNKEEAWQLLGKEYPIKQTLKKLMNLINGIVVVTDGNKGCHCYADKYYFIGTSGKKPMETTGAGDSFASAFVAGLMIGKDIPYSLKMGQANAESVIEKIGAKNDLLSLRRIQKAIKKANRKVVSKEI